MNMFFRGTKDTKDNKKNTNDFIDKTTENINAFKNKTKEMSRSTSSSVKNAKPRCDADVIKIEGSGEDYTTNIISGNKDHGCTIYISRSEATKFKNIVDDHLQSIKNDHEKIKKAKDEIIQAKNKIQKLEADIKQLEESKKEKSSNSISTGDNPIKCKIVDGLMNSLKKKITGTKDVSDILEYKDNIVEIDPIAKEIYVEFYGKRKDKASTRSMKNICILEDDDNTFPNCDQTGGNNNKSKYSTNLAITTDESTSYDICE